MGFDISLVPFQGQLLHYAHEREPKPARQLSNDLGKRYGIRFALQTSGETL